MMAESEAVSEPTPFCRGMRDLDTETADVVSILLHYAYNGVSFHVLVSAKETPPGYDLEQSIEGKILIELSDLSWGEPEEEKDSQYDHLSFELGRLGGDACLPLMRELAPFSRPEPRTLQEYMYPEGHVLQIFTEGDKLAAKTLEGYEIPDRHPPIPETRLKDIDVADTLLVLKPSQVTLGPRLQGLVWRVSIDGEDMVCKVALDLFEKAIGYELEAYSKIGKSAFKDTLKVPRLKGIVRSHTGVVGILLNYIPHKHPNLGALLRQVEDGTSSETEATPSMKKKWAGQIKQSLEQLHELGILWRDVKTDNILIDENGDAIVVDFGGGNTMGWVDRDKYGTMEGELQGIEKIMNALGESV